MSALGFASSVGRSRLWISSRGQPSWKLRHRPASRSLLKSPELRLGQPAGSLPTSRNTRASLTGSSRTTPFLRPPPDSEPASARPGPALAGRGQQQAAGDTREGEQVSRETGGAPRRCDTGSSHRRPLRHRRSRDRSGGSGGRCSARGDIHQWLRALASKGSRRRHGAASQPARPSSDKCGIFLYRSRLSRPDRDKFPGAGYVAQRAGF